MSLGGIFGVVLKSGKALELVLDGLKLLKHRGRDGVGIVTVYGGKLHVFKDVGDVDSVLPKVPRDLPGRVCLGHVRFATHGAPAKLNTHPHLDCSGKVAVVEDGSIYEYMSLRTRLEDAGHRFVSTCDAEVVAHLIEEYMRQGLAFKDAFREALRSVQGTFAVCAVNAEEEAIYCGCREHHIAVGEGGNGYFVCSEAPALSKFCDRFLYVESGEMCVIRSDGVELVRLSDGSKVVRGFMKLEYAPEYADKGGYPHYMLKEIFEVPEALVRSVYVPQEKYIELLATNIVRSREFHVIGCGSSLYAGMAAAYVFSAVAGVPTYVVDATEYPYLMLRRVQPGTTILALSQSGETSDVLYAIRLAKARGAVILSIINVLGSKLMYESNVYLPVGAGPEIAVPATKTFVAMLSVAYQVAYKTAQLNGEISESEYRSIKESIAQFGKELRDVLNSLSKVVKKVAETVKNWDRTYVLSQANLYPIAKEGALKLKETAYIHAEGMEALEIRHGPLATVEKDMPVVVLVPIERDARNRVLRVINELITRGAKPVVVVRDDLQHLVPREATKIVLPKLTLPDELYPLYAVIPLQLLAYWCGVFRGSPIDTPRALVKAVTT